MEAAAVAAERGHEVSLWERSDTLGGALLWATRMPLRREFSKLLDSQKLRLEAAGVKVSLGTDATAEQLSAAGADAVVWAAGAAPVAQGLCSGGAALTLQAALDDPEALGESVVMVDHLGGWSVVSVAEYLADHGKTVTLVAPTGTPGWTISMYSSFALRDRMRRKGVRIIGHHALEDHGAGLARLRDLSRVEAFLEIEATAVIAPLPGRPRTLSHETAGGIAGRSVSVGDCQSPRTALEAVFEGHDAGRAL
jgi:NADPH-dependent 2,4-dienoyl-CoA reductase/sulfur reductase-like enzyme